MSMESGAGPHIANTEVNPEAMNRRSFLRAAGVVAGAVAVGMSLAPPANAETKPTQPSRPSPDAANASPVSASGSHDSLFNRLAKWYDELGSPRQSAFEDAKMVGAVALSQIALSMALHGVLRRPSAIARRLGVFSHPGEEQHARKRRNFQTLVARNLTIVPLKEELMFRAAPSAALDLLHGRDRNYQKTSGSFGSAVVGSAAFGLWHNRYREGFSLYLPQAATGMAYWRIHRNGGIAHSVGAHIGNNLVAHSGDIALITRHHIAKRKRGY